MQKEVKFTTELRLSDTRGREFVVKSVDSELKLFMEAKPEVTVLKSFRSDSSAESWIKLNRTKFPKAKILKDFSGFDVLGPGPTMGMGAHVVVEESPMTQVIEAVSSRDTNDLFTELIKSGLLEVSEYGTLEVTDKFCTLKTDFLERAIGNVAKALTQQEASNDKGGNKAISDKEAVSGVEPDPVAEGTTADPAPDQAVTDEEADNKTQGNTSVAKAIDGVSQVAQALERQDLVGGKKIAAGTKMKNGKKVPNLIDADEIRKGFTIFKSHFDAQQYVASTQSSGKLRALSVKEKEQFGPWNFVVVEKP